MKKNIQILPGLCLMRETLGFLVLWCFSCGISVILPHRYGILFYPFKQFRYSVNFRRGTAVFHDFSPGIMVQSTPQCPPLHYTNRNIKWLSKTKDFRSKR